MPADENIGYTVHDEPPGSKWGEPDMSVIRGRTADRRRGCQLKY